MVESMLLIGKHAEHHSSHVCHQINVLESAGNTHLLAFSLVDNNGRLLNWLFSLSTVPFMSAHIGSMRHPPLGIWGSHQVVFALQQVLVLCVVSQPAKQGLTSIVAHTSVGQAHCQSHESREVVWVELQTPGRRQNSGI